MTQRRNTGRGGNYNNERATQLHTATQRLKSQKDELLKQLNDVTKKIKKIRNRNSEHPHVTPTDFESHAKRCVQKVIRYIRQKFLEDRAP